MECNGIKNVSRTLVHSKLPDTFLALPKTLEVTVEYLVALYARPLKYYPIRQFEWFCGTKWSKIVSRTLVHSKLPDTFSALPRTLEVTAQIITE